MIRKAKFLEIGQQDLFPDRSTVGWEHVAILLTAPKASPALTEIGRRQKFTAQRAPQMRMPLSRLYSTPDARRRIIS